MSNVPSILMTVGRAYYTLAEFIDEASNIGISKRIPLNTVPAGMEKGLSKIFVSHPDAIVKVTKDGATLQDLGYALVERGLLTQDQWVKLVELDQPFWTGQELQANDFVPASMLDITYAFSKLPKAEQTKLTKEFGLEFCMGVFGYAPYAGMQVVLRHDEKELPAELKHLEPLIEQGIIDPVYVFYTSSDGDEEDEDE